MLRKLRDIAVSAQLTRKIAPRLSDYCHMLKIDLDSKAKVLTVEALPKGESEPVRVELHGYDLLQEDGETVLRFQSLRVSREWLQVLADNLLREKRIPLPPDTPFGLLKVLV